MIVSVGCPAFYTAIVSGDEESHGIGTGFEAFLVEHVFRK
jgi:hypothetical protein